MQIKSQRKKHLLYSIAALFAFSMVCVALGAAIRWFSLAFNGSEDRAARATESALTVAYGAEVRLAIQAFININYSFADFRDPQRLAAVATGQNFKELQALKLQWSSNTVDVLKAGTINNVQVIDYSPTQFKAFSCEVLNFDTVTLDGTYVSSLNPLNVFRVYVFNRENGVWKVSAWADFTDVDHITRDWTERMYPQWKKDIIGDLPDLIQRYVSC